ncbi:MAG: DUF4390 domain-containing protein [Pseudomonadota bacterium]
MLLALPGVRAQSVADVTQLKVERSDEGVLLSATMAFELPAAVEDALSKGIAMYFVADAELSRDRWYWYDKRIAMATRSVRLSFQPLTRRWRVQVSANAPASSGPELTLGQNFESLTEALASVQRISRWKIAESAEVESLVKHTLEFSFRLDVSKLPRPFQIGAVGQNDWNISAKRTLRLVLEPER